MEPLNDCVSGWIINEKKCQARNSAIYSRALTCVLLSSAASCSAEIQTHLWYIRKMDYHWREIRPFRFDAIASTPEFSLVSSYRVLHGSSKANV